MTPAAAGGMHHQAAAGFRRGAGGFPRRAAAGGATSLSAVEIDLEKLRTFRASPQQLQMILTIAQLEEKKTRVTVRGLQHLLRVRNWDAWRRAIARAKFRGLIVTRRQPRRNAWLVELTAKGRQVVILNGRKDEQRTETG